MMTPALQARNISIPAVTIALQSPGFAILEFPFAIMVGTFCTFD